MTELEFILHTAKDIRQRIRKVEGELDYCNKRLEEYKGTAIDPSGIEAHKEMVQGRLDFELEKLAALGKIKEMVEQSLSL
jgi:hypothetical protein